MTPLHPLFARDVGPPEFVLDAALAASWVLPGVRSTYSSGVLHKMAGATVAVPTSWPVDLADLLRASERKGVVAGTRVDARLAMYSAFRVLIDGESPLRSWPPLLALARTRSMPVRKAAYLELAVRLALPLATVDPTLTRHATAAGVPIYSP